MNKKIKGLLLVFSAVMLVVLLYSGYKLTTTLHSYNVADRFYDKQASQFTSYAPTPAPNGPDSHPDALNTLQESSPRVVDFEALQAVCPDVRGWIYCADTVIDLPVVQGKDNAYYLHRLMDGSGNANGTLFIDYRCMGDFSGRNTVIYGHNMQNGAMFASIVNYRQQDYYDAHPVMYLNTPDGDYRLEVFSGFVTKEDSRVYTFYFTNNESYAAWLQEMAGYSEFSCDVSVGPEDRVVTLSTCCYDFNNARYVVLAKLVPLQ